jgi:hypothetical protein
MLYLFECRPAQEVHEVHIVRVPHGILEKFNWSHITADALMQLCTVADYRRFTVQLQLKTLLPGILLLTLAIKVQLR